LDLRSYTSAIQPLKFKIVTEAEYIEEGRDPNKDRPATKHRQHQVVPYDIPAADKSR
jgi:hypothetical protein